MNEGQARICTSEPRDKHDTIIVQEKLDGCCTAVAMHEGQVLALQRAGYLASSSPYLMLRKFASWVDAHEAMFRYLLREGERLCGEWMIQAHGTEYGEGVMHGPWVCFDLMQGHDRATVEELEERLEGYVDMPFIVYPRPTPPEALMKGYVDDLARSLTTQYLPYIGPVDSIEGFVYRVERKGKVDFLAKWVRPDKVDGLYLMQDPPVWNKYRLS